MRAARAAALLLTLLLAGCGNGAPSATPTPSLTAQQIAQKAADALTKLNSFHFDLSTDTGGKPIGNGLAVQSAKGDAVRPDKISAVIQASLGGFTATIQYIGVGDEHFMTDPISRQWTAVPQQFNAIALFAPDQGAAAILKGMENLEKTGTDKVDGVDSYKLAGTAKPDVLQPLLGVTAPAGLRVTAWVGTSDFLTRKIVIAGPIFAGEPDSTVRTLVLSNFNEQLTITAPSPGTVASPPPS